MFVRWLDSASWLGIWATFISIHVNEAIFIYRQIFCDFGEDFKVVDTNGEQPTSNMISAVTKVR